MHTSVTHVVAPGAASVCVVGHEKTPKRQLPRIESGAEPAGHDAHVAEPAGAYCASAHATHVDAAVAEKAGDAVPGGHGEHDARPSARPKEPGGHCTHFFASKAPGFGEYVPAGQKPSQNV
jgi:hypothetical protein